MVIIYKQGDTILWGEKKRFIISELIFIHHIKKSSLILNEKSFQICLWKRKLFNLCNNRVINPSPIQGAIEIVFPTHSEQKLVSYPSKKMLFYLLCYCSNW